MKVALKPLPVVDLSSRYSRRIGPNKVLHYRVPLGYSIASGKEPLELIKEFIQKKEGGEVEIDFTSYGSLLISNSNGPLATMDVSDILDVVPKVKKALLKTKATQLIHQTDESSVFSHIRAYLINSYRRLKNSIIKTSFWQEATPYTRYMNLTHFIVIGFKESDYEKAKQAMIKDLKILQKKGLILGHLSMPSVFRLADMVGYDEPRYAMFCYPILRASKLKKYVGDKYPFETNPLEKLGVQYAVGEGGIRYLDNLGPEADFEIETIDVDGISSDEARQAMIAAYEEALPVVQQVAAKTQELIEKHEDEVKAGMEVTIINPYKKSEQ